MGKPKQRQLVAIPKSKNGSLSDMYMDNEDGWVIVKKQRVTIWIPPLPHARKSTLPKPGPSNLDAMPVKVVNNKSTMPVEASNRMPSIDEQEKVASVAPNGGIKMPRKIHTQQTSTSHKVPRLSVEMGSKNSVRVHTSKSHNTLRISNISKTIKQPRLLYGQGRFLDGSMLQNQRLTGCLIHRLLKQYD